MNKFRLILLICFVGILNSQSMADLDNLPPEIRKSILERMVPKEQLFEAKFLSLDSDELEME